MLDSSRKDPAKDLKRPGETYKKRRLKDEGAIKPKPMPGERRFDNKVKDPPGRQPQKVERLIQGPARRDKPAADNKKRPPQPNVRRPAPVRR